MMNFKKHMLLSLALLWSVECTHAEAIVEKIEISPADQASVVMAILPFRDGDPYDAKLVDISKKLLMATDKFDQASVEWNASRQQMKVEVSPKLYFDDFVWVGEELPGRERIRQVCILPYEARAISQERISQISQCLLRDIRGHGYLDAELYLEPVAEVLKIHLSLGGVYLVSEISFEGIDKIEETELSEPLANKVGFPFLGSKIDEDTKLLLKAYFDEGFYFAEIFKPILKMDPASKTVKIQWKVKESYSMDIKFTGQRKSRKLLYQYMEREQTFPNWFVDEMIDDLNASLKNEGYLAAEIKVEKSINQWGAEQVDIRTRTGPRFLLTNPEWIGVGDQLSISKFYKSISDFDVSSPFEEEEYRRLLSDAFIPLLVSHGYLDAKIRNLDFVIDRENALVRPVIYLSEGDVYLIKSAVIEGLPPELSDLQEVKDLRNAFKVGKPFDSISVSNLDQELQRALLALGYLDAKVDRKLKAGSDKGIDISISVSPGVRYRVAKVLIRGAIKTDYNVLKREVQISTGDYYEDEKIKDSISQILRLGIARSVDIQVLEKDTESAGVYALVDVQEAARFRFEIGPGYGTLDGLRGVFKATYANINGTARRLTLYTKASRRIQEDPIDRTRYTLIEEVPFIQRRVSLEYFEPSFLGLPIDGRLNYTHAKEESNRLGEENSFTASLDYRLSRHWLFTSVYGLAFSDPFNLLISSIQLHPEDGESKRFTNVGEIIVIDYLNDSFNPSSGFRTRLQGDLYDKHFGGEVNFWQASMRQEVFAPLWVFRKNRMIGIALNTGAGFSNSYDPSPEVPVEKRSEIGGETTVRGYDRGTINPSRNGLAQEGGNSYFFFQTELNIPLFFGVDLLGFFDGGNAFLKNGKFHPWDLRYGAGPGLRWNTPVGPLKVGYGFKLFQRAGEDIGAFYIGVGAI